MAGSDVKVSGLAQDSSLSALDYILSVEASGPTTKRILLSVLAAWLFDQANIPAGSGSPITHTDDLTYDHVLSGGVWSPDSAGSNRNASMTALVAYINGRKISISAVTARTFTASKDTYIDILDNQDGTGTLVYTEVSNNAASPSLAANSMRIGIIITGASSIANTGSVNQGQVTKVLPIASSIPYTVTDSLGNLICPRDPQRKVLGYRQITSNFTTTTAGSYVDVTGLSAPVIVPTGRKVRITAFAPWHSTSNAGATGIYFAILESSTKLAECVSTSNGSSFANPANAVDVREPTAGLQTYKVQGRQDNAGTYTVNVNSLKAFILVELV